MSQCLDRRIPCRSHSSFGFVLRRILVLFDWMAHKILMIMYSFCVSDSGMLDFRCVSDSPHFGFGSCVGFSGFDCVVFRYFKFCFFERYVLFFSLLGGLRDSPSVCFGCVSCSPDVWFR